MSKKNKKKKKEDLMLAPKTRSFQRCSISPSMANSADTDGWMMSLSQMCIINRLCQQLGEIDRNIGSTSSPVT